MSSAALAYPSPALLPMPGTPHTPRFRALRAVEDQAEPEPPDPHPAAPPALPAETAVLLPGVPPLTHRLVGRVAVFACEAVDGTRSIGALAGWITTGAARELAEYRSLNVGRRSLYRDYRRVVATVRRVRLSEPRERAVEAAVVLDTAGRSRAVALRFEAARGRWQATSITVL